MQYVLIIITRILNNLNPETHAKSNATFLLFTRLFTINHKTLYYEKV